MIILRLACTHQNYRFELLGIAKKMKTKYKVLELEEFNVI